MNAFVVATIFIFIAAFILGWWRYRAFFWNYVDLIYYPLAAIGVLFLFFSNDVQRELLEVTKFHKQESLALLELKTKRPSIGVRDPANLLGVNVEHIALIARWADSCTNFPSSIDVRCLAVKKLGPPVAKFLKVAQGQFPSYEDQLLSTCTAGEKLIEEIYASEAISTLVMEKLLAQYAQVTVLQLSVLQYEEYDRQIQEFKRNATAYTEQIHRMAFKPEDSSGQLILGIRRAEIEYGEILLRGLFQCVSVPKDKIVLLNKWMSATSTKEQEVVRLEAHRQQLEKATTRHPSVLWLQLNAWPLVLILALSLKFAKGAASLRKARKSPS